ncbi:MAG: sensor histidine kinase [Caldimicrobium sp.]
MKFSFLKSLKAKVFVGYFFALILLFFVVLINWHNFESLEMLVLSAEKTSELIDLSLEIRRYEKNYFLYEKEEDFLEILKYLQDFKSLVKNTKTDSKNQGDLSLLLDKGTLLAIIEASNEYEAILNQLKIAKKEEKNILKEKLRDKGRELAKVAEKIAQNKKEIIKLTLNNLRNIFLISLVFIMLIGFIGALLFYRMFARPLMLLEEYMKKIAEGKYTFMPVISEDREILSLSNAFNKMLAELEERHTYLIQTEKLASMGTLLFSVAHELNNPLNNISTSCQILKEEIESEDLNFKRELLSQIEEETDRARDIVRSILDYSKPGKKINISLNSVIKEAIRFIKAEIPPKIELVIDLPEEITIFADPQQIKQVFLNLMKNSLEAIEKEGMIKISAKEQNDFVEIVFSDTGKGIPKEAISRIFEPFFTTKEGKKGYGLGLFIVHKIIKEHGGNIEVHSEPGKGTSFIITLPSKKFEDSYENGGISHEHKT